MRSLKIFSIFILSLLLLTLVGCSSLGRIKRDFEKAGYTYDEKSTQQIKALQDEFEDKDIIVTPYLFTKGLNIAIILEFKSTSQMNKQIKESETLKGLLKDLQRSDFVRGNCILIPLGINTKEMIDIFQGRKIEKK